MRWRYIYLQLCFMKYHKEGKTYNFQIALQLFFYFTAFVKVASLRMRGIVNMLPNHDIRAYVYTFYIKLDK